MAARDSWRREGELCGELAARLVTVPLMGDDKLRGMAGRRAPVTSLPTSLVPDVSTLPSVSLCVKTLSLALGLAVEVG